MKNGPLKRMDIEKDGGYKSVGMVKKSCGARGGRRKMFAGNRFSDVGDGLATKSAPRKIAPWGWWTTQ